MPFIFPEIIALRHYPDFHPSSVGIDERVTDAPQIHPQHRNINAVLRSVNRLRKIHIDSTAF